MNHFNCISTLGITIAILLLHNQSYYRHYLMMFQRVWLSSWFYFSSHSSGRMPWTLALQGGPMVSPAKPHGPPAFCWLFHTWPCHPGVSRSPPASLCCSVAFCGVWVQVIRPELQVGIFGVYFSCGGTKPDLEVRCGWMIATPDPWPEALHYIKRFFLH